MTRHVAIAIFDDVELLDFCGPFEVFSVTSRLAEDNPFEAFTVGDAFASITTRGGMKVIPRYSFTDCPEPQILIVPGGQGTRIIMESPIWLDWIRAQHEKTELTLSVCTGALVLGKAGILDGLEATTHASAIDQLREIAPETRLNSGQRFVYNGKVITSAGIAAGIDMSLHVVARLLGQEHARKTAEHMEYRWLDGSNA